MGFGIRFIVKRLLASFVRFSCDRYGLEQLAQIVGDFAKRLQSGFQACELFLFGGNGCFKRFMSRNESLYIYVRFIGVCFEVSDGSAVLIQFSLCSSPKRCLLDLNTFPTYCS